MTHWVELKHWRFPTEQMEVEIVAEYNGFIAILLFLTTDLGIFLSGQYYLTDHKHIGLLA